MITVENLYYSVRRKTILNNISFFVNKGERLAILGTNGSGKTTLLEVLTNVLKPDKGSVSFDGKSFRIFRKNVGVIWSNISIYPWLKVREVITYISSIYHVKMTNSKLYEELQIVEIEHKLMKNLSIGELKRVVMYLSLMHNPQLLIMDEGTSELDPYIRNKVWQYLIENERTILFTTHHWNEAEQYASKVMFIHNGSVIYPPSTINDLFQDVSLSEKIIVDASIQIEIPSSVIHYELNGNIIYLVKKDDKTIIELIKSQTKKYSILPVDLMDIYQYIKNKSLL